MTRRETEFTEFTTEEAQAFAYRAAAYEVHIERRYQVELALRCKADGDGFGADFHRYTDSRLEVVECILRDRGDALMQQHEATREHVERLRAALEMAEAGLVDCASNDGLTDGERAELAQRYDATIGATPVRSPERTERLRDAPTGAPFPPVSVGVAADGTGVTGPLSSRVQVVSPDPSAATTTKAHALDGEDNPYPACPRCEGTGMETDPSARLCIRCSGSGNDVPTRHDAGRRS